ncbi:MAG: cob(I)yrinic acid a,c-diamide adenosyltransferase [Treponema sp.]|jgi:cob(I)alamin adenosyltransferase|nr:cob(I)yrinic acid a,c-diamide adenosyltransferase [Treponema sp.]
MTKGLIHLYIGDGKGKTTAAVGLSVRAAGQDKRVIFSQFLKTGTTGEIRSLERLGIRVIRSEVNLGFTYQMDPSARERCKAEQGTILRRVRELVAAEPVDILVLDEVLDAVNTQMLEEGELRSLIAHKPGSLEVVITGRHPGPWLMEAADYVSEVSKVKHPYDRGITARIGIER